MDTRLSCSAKKKGSPFFGADKKIANRQAHATIQKACLQKVKYNGVYCARFNCVALKYPSKLAMN